MSISTITWVHVPPGTQLEVRVEPQGEAFISGGDIFMQDKGLLPVKQWSDGQLRPGPAIELLKDGVDYTVDVRMAAAGTADVSGRLRAVLREASSQTMLEEEESPFNLTRGTHHLVRIFVDADPVVASGPAEAASAAVPRGAVPPRGRARAPRGKKRGK